MSPRIAVRQGVGITAGILQQQELEFKRLFIESPVLIFVEQGVKALRWSGGEYLIRPGEALAIAGGQSVDITNRLAADGSYRARWLVWETGLLAAHGEVHHQLPIIRHALPITTRSEQFSGAFQAALQAVEDSSIPLEIARHRVSELLLWLGMNGGRFVPDQKPSLSTRIRRLIGRDLDQVWSAQRVASVLAMSEATLRRKLMREATTLTDILVDARMSMALKLLQSTEKPVSQVAQAVGYQTASQFAVRFRQRFGFTPTAIRVGSHPKVPIKARCSE
ncbi:AraC family transcriptional regulator [Curvibacter sp. RS43]|uniref:AraC family transcriptional regulator n=1 Tax=Curvibacter microcysteis TaxID=3026419 RepID=UPI00235E0D2C|nr:AraC family transcriptional regulator [Curvibacter sp. RS43]MDD0812957.1 AraC family transcriptional regulator [Curvibacter sp. RS43]